MKMELVGFQNVDYTSSKTGKHVDGYNLAVTVEKRGYEGYAVDSIYVSKELCRKSGFTPVVGSIIEIGYEKFGANFYPAEIRIVEI